MIELGIGIAIVLGLIWWMSKLPEEVDYSLNYQDDYYKRYRKVVDNPPPLFTPVKIENKNKVYTPRIRTAKIPVEKTVLNEKEDLNQMSNYDPYLEEERCYQRLVKDYQKHGTLVVAVDFDGTVFDLHENGFEFPSVFDLLHNCKELGFKIVAFSASPAERHDLIREHFQANGVELDGVNEDVFITWRNPERDYSKSKIFYNVFLCDRAGLPSAYNILNRLVSNILKGDNLE